MDVNKSSWNYNRDLMVWNTATKLIFICTSSCIVWHMHCLALAHFLCHSTRVLDNIQALLWSSAASLRPVISSRGPTQSRYSSSHTASSYAWLRMPPDSQIPWEDPQRILRGLGKTDNGLSANAIAHHRTSQPSRSSREGVKRCGARGISTTWVEGQSGWWCRDGWRSCTPWICWRSPESIQAQYLGSFQDLGTQGKPGEAPINWVEVP